MVGRRRRLIGWGAVLLATWLAGNAASAENAARHTLDSGTGAVSVTADKMAFSNLEGIITFTGSVNVVKDAYTMQADRLEVTLEGAPEGKRRDIGRMTAAGNVVFTYGERTATAGRAVYEPKAERVTLTEHPTLTDATVSVVGERITIDLATQESTVQGGEFTFTEGR